MVLDAFGPNRLMWGSDWPVVTAHLAYGEWLRRSMELAAELSESERARLFGETAAEAYLGDMTGSGTPHGRKWLDARTDYKSLILRTGRP